MDADEQRYTDSWLKFAGWTTGRALLRCGAAGSGLCGSLLPATAAMQAVDEGFLPVTWWRRGARAGVAAAEAFANGALADDGAPAVSSSWVARWSPRFRRRADGRARVSPVRSQAG